MTRRGRWARAVRLAIASLSGGAALPPLVHCAKPRLPRPWRESGLRRDIFVRHCGLAPGGGRSYRRDRSLEGRRWSMNALLMDYLPLVVFIGVALVIGLALMIAPFLVAYKQPDPEK